MTVMAMRSVMVLVMAVVRVMVMRERLRVSCGECSVIRGVQRHAGSAVSCGRINSRGPVQFVNINAFLT